MIISIFYYTIINIIVKPGCYMPGFFMCVGHDTNLTGAHPINQGD